MQKSQYKNKRVLNCWSHKRINKLAEALGVKDNIPAWPRLDYETVYYLQYTDGLQVPKLTILQQQFPVGDNFSWQHLF